MPRSAPCDIPAEEGENPKRIDVPQHACHPIESCRVLCSQKLGGSPLARHWPLHRSIPYKAQGTDSTIASQRKAEGQGGGRGRQRGGAGQARTRREAEEQERQAREERGKRRGAGGRQQRRQGRQASAGQRRGRDEVEQVAGDKL